MPILALLPMLYLCEKLEFGDKLKENYVWSYFLFFPYHSSQVSYILHIILQNFQGSFISYYYPLVQKGEQSLFVLGVVVYVYLQNKNPTVMAHSHCTGPGQGNDGSVYYAMYCTHFTGTGTVYHCFLLCLSWTLSLSQSRAVCISH